MSKTRTFVAVAASEDLRERAQAAIATLRSAVDNIKWVSPENLHWTLQFLGDISDSEIADVCRLVAKVASRFEPFPLTAEGIGAFPSVDRPRALWLGAGQGGEDLCVLQRSIEEALAELGFRGERRRFVPHLTIGRVGRGSHGGTRLAEQVVALADFEGGAMIVEELTVFASRLERKGPAYHVLSHAPLAG